MMTDHTQPNARFRAALRERIEHDASNTRTRRRARILLLAAATVIAAGGIVLAQPFGGERSAIARARAGLDLPSVGILHATVQDAAGTVVEETWQSLSNPNEQRRYENYPNQPDGYNETATADSIHQRYDAATNTIYTQRVIESVGYWSEAANIPSIRYWLEHLHPIDRGLVDFEGRRLRRFDLAGAQGAPNTSCSYYVKDATYLPARLECFTDGKRSGTSDYAFLPDTPANRSHFSLTSVHPDAQITQDPAGIPGAAGSDLSAVTSTGLEDATRGKQYLQRTDEDAMRLVRTEEVALNTKLEQCFIEHHASRVQVDTGESTYHDPTGIVGAICQHFEIDRNTLELTPAGSALQRRESAYSSRVGECVKKRKPSRAETTRVNKECEHANPDAFLASLAQYR